MAEHDRTRWTTLVADFESSDLTQREFATERGISLSHLRYWIYRLRKESRPLVTEEAKSSDQAPAQGTAPEDSRLLPVRVVASASKTRTAVVVRAATDELLEVLRAFTVLDDALVRSPLPEEPRNVRELEEWLVALRRGVFAPSGVTPV